MRRHTLLTLSLGGLLGSTTAAAAEPAGQTPTVRPPISQAVTGGAVLLGAAYGLALYLPVRQGFEGDATWLTVPMIGPFAAMADRPDDVGYSGLVFDGLAQIGGAVLIGTGIADSNRAAPAVSLRVWGDRRGCSVVARF
jgi:hypothetical protein